MSPTLAARTPDLTARLFDELAPVRARLSAHDERVLATQIALCEIPSPTGSEAERGQCVASRFRHIGLIDVHTDDVGNVLGTRPGRFDLEPLVICSHLDTVFPVGTPIEVKRDGTHLAGPGIVDNARGLAVMLAVAEAIDGSQLATDRPILFAATVGEEGSGDLKGAKHLFANMAERPSACIALDGAGDERIVTHSLGCRRFRITYHGEGGHSWSSFGVANPVHAAGAAAARLAAMALPRVPRTALSVCRMGGGLSINAIPRDAWIEVDLRSSSADVLARCSRDIEQAVNAAARDENVRRTPGTDALRVQIEVIGQRPCGSLADDHVLVRAAERVTRLVGRTPDVSTASTDANVPISLGIPAIAIGAGGRAGAVHSTSEWFDNTDGAIGVGRALTLVCAAASSSD